MSENLEQGSVEQSENKEPVNKEPQFTEIEQKALEMGWRPITEFHGSEDEFIDAKEFVRRKPLFDRIESQSRELKEIRKALQELGSHHQKVKEVEFQRALETLKTEKLEALKGGDPEKLVEIDDKISDLKAERKIQESEERKAASQPHPSFIKWVDQNSWYIQDSEARQFADAFGAGIRQKFNDPDEWLEAVKKATVRQFPEKFRNTNKDKAPPVVGGDSKTNKKSESESSDDFELSEEERKTMNTFLRLGAIKDKKTYIEELKKVKGR